MNKRFFSNILINRPFQLSILGWFMLLTLIIVGVFYLSNWYFFEAMKQDAVSAGLPNNHVFFHYLDVQKAFMVKVFAWTSVFSAMVILVGGFVLSHKVAGPLHQLTQHLKGHPLRDMRPLRFRKGDYFPEIEEAFNEAIKDK